MTKTADTLKAMLTENTGRHMLDSGGAYGRAWQENQERNFAAEPAATITVEEGYIDIRRSTFHFLNECLEFDEAMNQRFYEFEQSREFEKFSLLEEPRSRLALMEEFAESIEASGIYGEGAPITVNTYNHDSLLDQVIQYVYFELCEQGYVLLQIHGGCDVRGGYTAPKAFRCNIEDSQSIFSDGDATITCKGGDHRWYYDEGRGEADHWESNWESDSRGLDKFPIYKANKSDPTQWEATYHKEARIPEGTIWQDADGVHCPLCGGILEVW